MRPQTAAGAVISRKAGEEVRFIDVSDWRFVDLKQDLLAGDILRTNETGQLAILFSDRTQVRLGRNSTLVVKQITAGTSSDTVLQLQSGTIWARAERGGTGVKVETAAAAAAIRGTDWTMTVKGSQTSLNVLEGQVQLSNPQGTVDVRQGEGAVASIGQAPRKVVIVNSDDREQMLFYMPAREAFSAMPAATMPLTQMRQDADRILKILPGKRTTEDWLGLAEAQLTLEGRDSTGRTVSFLENRSLSGAQRARLDLIRAILLASDKNYAEAATLFARAQPKLDARRRGIALYGGYFARSLADPKHVEPLPSVTGGPEGAFLRAYAVGFLQDLKAAMKVLQDAEQRYPDDARLPAYRAAVAMLINDRKEYEEAVARSLALDPNEPTALEARANFRAGFQGDYKGAINDLDAALKTVPGSSSGWNALGNVQSARDANREGEAAFKKAIALDPNDPVAHANLATFYLDMNRTEDAKREIDLALAVDPGFDLALVARGRYYLQTGDADKALDDLLAGTVANPAYSQGQLVLAVAHYQKGDRVAAEQALDNADRLDKNDPVISSMRAAIASDDYDSEGAIRNAQEYLRRSKARGGDFTSVGANHEAGSTLNDAFRLQGLNAWGEYYGDAAFDAFEGTAYVDQSVRGSTSPFANDYFYGGNIINNDANGQVFSSLFQGILLNPHMISGPSRKATLFQQPFLEGALGGGFTTAGGETGQTANAEVQGYSNRPIPMSLLANIEWQNVPDSRSSAIITDLATENKLIGGSGYLTASLTPYDRLVFYFNDYKTGIDRDFTIPAAGLTTEQKVSAQLTNAGLGYSHTVSYENVFNAAVLYSGLRSKDMNNLDLAGGVLPASRTIDEFDQETYIAAVNHMVGNGDLTWRYGMEGGLIRSDQTSLAERFVAPPTATFDREPQRTTVARVYVDLLQDISADLKAEYALFGSYMQGDDADVSRLEPRAGFAWSPTNGQWLRAGAMRSSIDLTTPTLSPIGVVSLQPNDISVETGGYVDTYAFRWDAEWTPDVFTALQFQHQDLKEPRIGIPLGATQFSTGEGRIDRASLTANMFLGHGFGLSSTVAYSRSKDEDPGSATYGEQLAFLPQWAGQVALTWVNQANIKATIAANYVGRRNNEFATRLDDYWTLDANLTWEPFGKRFELDLEAYNLLDEEIEVDRGVPGWGRSFKSTLRVRF